MPKECPLNQRQREIIGIVIFAFAVFSVVSLYVQAAGIVGYQVREWLRLLFGRTAPVSGLALALVAVHIFRGSLWPIRVRKALGYAAAVVSLLALFHTLSVYQGYQLPPSWEQEVAFASGSVGPGVGAGVVGAILMVAFLTAFGLPGAYILLFSVFLIGIILVSDIPFGTLIRLTGRAFTQAVRFLLFTASRSVQNLKDRAAAWLERRKRRHMERRLDRDKAAQKKKPSRKQRTSSEEQPRSEADTSGAGGSRDSTGFDAVFSQPEKTPTADASAQTKGSAVSTRKRRTPESPVASSASLPEYPPLYLLKKSGGRQRAGQQKDSQRELLEETFSSFGISASVVNVCQGPVVTRYELQLARGIKVSRITSLADDLALSLAASDVRIEAPVPGKSVIGIEVPNQERQPVLMRDVLEQPEFQQHDSKVALALGQDIAGNPVIADLRKWLHVLVAGATGSGKSVCLNSMIGSILFKAAPSDVKLLMIDPKRVELAVYDGVPHLISPVVTDPKKAATALRWAVAEMERRYKLFADTGVRNIDMYEELYAKQSTAEPENPPEGNADSDPEGSEEERNGLEPLPLIVIVIDELADLMMVAASEVEDAICRLAQMARAAGMYLIIATQRPSVDVITGLIKANVPSRIAFSVSSQVDSRTILDMAGAERLIGKGDMLFYPLGASKPTRAQGAWISDSEVEELVLFWKNRADPEYQEEVMDPPEVSVNGGSDADADELLDDAVRLVIDTGQASISLLQRRFRIGYSRAARLIDMMEVRGIVGPYQGSKPRDVLVDESTLESAR